MSEFDEWLGRTHEAADFSTAAPLRGLAALLDQPDTRPSVVPPLGHWLYFLPSARQRDLGQDGHPALGGELPDLGLPRRMWAGSRIEFMKPIQVGEQLLRHTSIASIARKEGRTGPLAFVTLPFD